MNIGATISAIAKLGRKYIAFALGACELMCETIPRLWKFAMNWKIIIQKITVPLNRSMLKILSLFLTSFNVVALINSSPSIFVDFILSYAK